jgi:hypothetical protein
MPIKKEPELQPALTIPDALLPQADRTLPSLSQEVLEKLRGSGWKTVGLMVAFTDSTGNIMMLEHNGRDKNEPGALGPLGETSQCSGPIVEQPAETLYRGIQEELGIQHPVELDFWMYRRAGWVVNEWPRGNAYQGEFACAISFPVFMPDSLKEYLLAIPHGTEEVGRMHFIDKETILAMEESRLRPGTKQWLTQLDQAGLFVPEQYGALEQIDFSQIYEASLRDVEL